MPRPCVAYLLAAGVLLAFSGPAHATGFGVFVEYGNVFDAELEENTDYEEDHYGAGFTLDTNVAGDRLFNYRLDVGYQHVDGEYDTGFGSVDDEGDGFMLDNSFGFGVVRNDRLRLWVGPAVRLSFDFFEDPDLFEFGIGVGPAVGLNLHAGDAVSLGVSTGFQISYVVGDADLGGDYDGYEQLAFVRMSVMFRTADDGFSADVR